MKGMFTMGMMQPPLPEAQFLKSLCENYLFLRRGGEGGEKVKNPIFALLPILIVLERSFAISKNY